MNNDEQEREQEQSTYTEESESVTLYRDGISDTYHQPSTSSSHQSTVDDVLEAIRDLPEDNLHNLLDEGSNLNEKEKLKILAQTQVNSQRQLTNNLSKTISVLRERMDIKMAENNKVLIAQIDQLLNEKMEKKKIEEIKRRGISHIPIAVNFASTNQLNKVGVEPRLTKKLISYDFPTEHFSGKKEKHGLTVENFIRGMKTGQDIHNLSEREFLDELECRTSGQVRSLIGCWRRNNLKAEEIQSSLLTKYMSTLTPTEATERLNNFKITGNINCMSDLETEIELLASDASVLGLDEDQNRKQFNWVANTNLLRNIPVEQRDKCQDVYNTLKRDLRGEEPSFSDLCTNLIQYHPTINPAIKAISAKAKNKPENKPGTSNPASSANFGKNNFKNSKGKSKAQVSQVETDKKAQQKGKKMAAPRQGGYEKKNPPCPMCGSWQHDALNCTALRDDTGVRRQEAPTYGPCADCLQTFRKTYKHSTQLCPKREAMLNLYEAGTVVPSGDFFKYFSHLLPSHLRQQLRQKNAARQQK